MFGLGMGELLVILAIALIFLGPKRLPDVATSLGKAIRSFRKATRDLTDQLEIDEDVKAPLRELQSALRDEPPPAQPLAVVKPVPPPAGTAAKPPALPANGAAPPAAIDVVAASPAPSTTPSPPVADKKA
jgi:TatA/E family protein of Tat protein translocase